MTTFDSGADRHTNLGAGHIDGADLADVVRAAGAPVVVETPGWRRGPERRHRLAARAPGALSRVTHPDDPDGAASAGEVAPGAREVAPRTERRDPAVDEDEHAVGLGEGGPLRGRADDRGVAGA